MLTPVRKVKRLRARVKRDYGKCRDQILKRKNNKYANDPAFRERALGRTRRQEALLRAGYLPPIIMKTIDGKKAYPASFILRVHNLNKKQFRALIRQGFIPEHTLSGSHRYYTTKQVSLLRDYFNARKLSEAHELDALRRMHRLW